MVNFAKWVHPSTGAVRVYISGLGGQRGAKIWVEEQAADAFGCTLAIRARAENLTRGEVGNLQNDAEQVITQALGRRAKLFADVLAIAA